MVEWFPSWIFYWRHIRYSNIGFSPKRYNLKTNKMTAVEFLEMMQIKNGSLSKTDFKIAKGMEKQQIIDALKEGDKIQQAKEMEKQQQGYSEEDLKEAFSMGRLSKSIKDFNQRFKNK